MLESCGGFGEVEYVTQEELKLLGADTCINYCKNDCNCGNASKCAVSLKCAYNEMINENHIRRGLV